MMNTDNIKKERFKFSEVILNNIEGAILWNKQQYLDAINSALESYEKALIERIKAEVKL